MVDPIITNLVSLGIGGCMAALVVWHVWYTQTQQIPDMVQRFTGSVETLAKAHETQIKEERQNSDLRAKIDRESAERLVATEREITQMRHAENNQQSALIISSLREVHHQLQNMANATTLHNALVNQMLNLEDKQNEKLKSSRDTDTMPAFAGPDPKEKR